MSIGYDVFKYSDAWTSEWEYAVQCGYFTIKDVADLFKENLITTEEYIYASDYLEGSENVYTARANELYRRLGHSCNNEPEQMENTIQIMGRKDGQN